MFSNLSLPLPDTNHLTLQVIVNLIPYEIKSILEDTKEEMEQLANVNFEIARKQSLHYDAFEQIFQAQTKELPLKVTLQID